MTTIYTPNTSVSFGGTNPTAIVGERINPTGKSTLTQALLRNDFSVVAAEARRQAAAGATVIDVNVSASGVDEPVALRRAIEVVREVCDLPLCIDSPSPAALAAALPVYQGKPLVNSVTGEPSSLDAVLPLVRDRGAAVVGLLQDDDGIPCTVEARMAIAKRILDRVLAMGIPQDDLVIDCVCLSAGFDPSAPAVALQTIRQVTEQLGLTTILGASNVSFGLPERNRVNSTFIGMAIGAGLSAAIVDPTVHEVVDAIYAADLIAGRDDFGMRYVTHYRATHQSSGS